MSDHAPDRNMRILVLGAGATGGYYGGRLVEAGADVTFLVRAGRKAHLDRDGLVIDSPLGSARLPVAAVTSADGLGAVDLVLLTPKAYDLAAALDAIAPAVGPGTAVMPVLNGVTHLDVIAARFPDARAWGGVAHIGATLAPDGTIRHLNRLARLLFGPRTGEDPRAAALARLLPPPAVEALVRPAIEQDLWDKIVFLATLAGATCLFRTSIGGIVATRAGTGYVEGLLDDCAAVAAAEGFPLADVELARARRELTKPGSGFTASMLRDIERGGPTERAHILGDLIDRAMRHGLSVPRLALADSHVAAYEARRASGG